MPKYRIHWTEDYLIECYVRYRAQSPKRMWLVPLKIIGFLGLALLLAGGVYEKSFALAAVPGFFLLLLLAGPRFDYMLMKRRFRHSPFYNNHVVVELTEAGYKSESESGKAEMPWRTFTKAHRMPDGFLLLTGPSLTYWWPDSSLAEGTISDIEQLLQKAGIPYKN